MSKLVEFLRARTNHAIAHGHEYVQLVKQLRSSPKNWDRVRIVPGRPSLMARCDGPTGRWPNEFLFSVKRVELEAWLEKRNASDGRGPGSE